MSRTWSALALLLPFAAAVADEPKALPPDEQQKPRHVVLAAAKEAPKFRDLRYQLLPPQADLTPGNAAPMWLRAGRAVQEHRAKMTDKEYNWGFSGETPLAKFPKKEAAALLKNYEPALRTAHLAARRERCDWEMPPLTMQSISNDLPLSEVQVCREIASVLSIKIRLEMSEGRWDEAAEALQTGFALARHVGEGDTLIQNLVGIAITAIMLGHVEDWMQQPGSPNLYWALTTMPSPFIDLRRSTQYEMNTIHRSFPALRDLGGDRAGNKSLSAAEVERLTDQLAASLASTADPKAPAWQMKLAMVAAAMKSYPDAKKYLMAQGKTEDEVSAMPTQQVVLYYYIDQYNQVRDDVIKWSSLPYHQGRPGLLEVENRVKKMPRDMGTMLIGLLMPAIMKTQDAGVRTERTFAMLRTAEALRYYAARHEGQPPATLAAITEAPAPADPLTGKSFEPMYKVKDGKATLEVPPMPNMPAQLGRVYELSAPK